MTGLRLLKTLASTSTGYRCLLSVDGQTAILSRILPKRLEQRRCTAIVRVGKRVANHCQDPRRLAVELAGRNDDFAGNVEDVGLPIMIAVREAWRRSARPWP